MEVSSPPTAPSFGHLLRQWRQKRRVSQLELATRSKTSQRHVSFLESGRARPSRGMIVALAETLDIPLRSRNRLFHSAGFAPMYVHSHIDDGRLESANRALRMMLDKHEPYPAIVVDSAWNLIMANRGAKQFFGPIVQLGGDAVSQNILKHVLDPDGIRGRLKNWRPVARFMLDKLERELQMRLPPDDDLNNLLGDLQSKATDVTCKADDESSLGSDPSIALEFEIDGKIIRLFSIIATFGTPQDVTLQELRYEAFFPADEVSRNRLEELSKQSARSQQ